MRTCVVLHCLALAVAHNATANGDCDGKLCRDRCNQQYSGHPATCYCAKACSDMDCSHEYHVNDDQAMCRNAPADRHSVCMNKCKNAGSGHDDWVQDCKFGCGYWCDVTTSTGHWAYEQSISLPGSIKFTVGTKKKHSESKTHEWSQSVTRTMEKGFGFGKWSVTMQEGWVETNSDVWERDVGFSWKIKATEAEVDKAAWLFILTHTDVCGHKETTITRELALTESLDQKPCCMPGHAKKRDYQECTNGKSLCKGELTV